MKNLVSAYTRSASLSILLVLTRLIAKRTRKVVSIIPFCRWERWGTEKLLLKSALGAYRVICNSSQHKQWDPTQEVLFEGNLKF